jgi:ketosteroid isomerase-like protein
MNKADFQHLFKAIDKMDTNEFASYLADDSLLRFANMPTVEGKENIYEFIGNFFLSISGIKHDELEIWQLPEVTFVNGRVTYTRKSGTKLSVYFSNTFKMKNGKIREYLIHVDNSTLYTEE